MRAHSSAVELLPYKQAVTGSIPVAPTDTKTASDAMKGARPEATLGIREVAVVGGSPYGSSGSKLSRSPFFIANNVTVDLVQAPVLE
jgi:hypothetical protein